MSRTRKIVFFCSIAVMAAAIVFLLVYWFRQADNSAVYDDLRDAVSAPPLAQPTPTVIPSVEPTPEPYVSPIDFEALWEINTDIYAWIEVPGTDVSYPVVQHPTSDAYYLNYTIEGKYGLPGSIYTEPSVNAKDFSDFNTIIYGHNMWSRTMFSSLLDYRDAAFLEENREILIYTPDAEYHYTIFAAVIYSDAYIPYYYDSETEAGRQAFLDSIGDTRDMNNHILTDVEVTPDSHVLTLSTCTGPNGRSDQRYLVIAVLDEEELPVEGTLT